MEIDNINIEDDKKQKFYRNRTMAVLQKWGVEGEINEFNVRKAASSYARIQIKNKMMSWVTFGALAFLLVFMGMMIASVVIGINVSKDIKEKDQVLVSSSGRSTPLKTAQMMYSTDLKLTTPLSVIQGIKSLRFDLKTIDGDKEYFEFEVVSFYYSKGRKLIMYGHSHAANVNADGSVDLIPVVESNGSKRFDSSKKRSSSEVSGNTDAQPEPESAADAKISIYNCEQFLNLEENGSYQLLTNLTCSFDAPLKAFAGKFDGNGNTLTLSIKINGPAALWSELKHGSSVSKLIVQGSVEGEGRCATLALQVDAGVYFYTVGIYTTINCNTANAYPNVIAGLFASTIQNPNHLDNTGVAFFNSVSQGIIKTNALNHAVIGGFYGLAIDTKISIRGAGAASFFPGLNNVDILTNSSDISNQYDTFGFKQSSSKRGVMENGDCESTWIGWYEGTEEEILQFRSITSSQCFTYYYANSWVESECCPSDFQIDYYQYTFACPNYSQTGICMYWPTSQNRDSTTTNANTTRGGFKDPSEAPIFYPKNSAC